MTIFDVILPALCFNTLCFDDLDTKEVCFNQPCPPEDEILYSHHYKTRKFLNLLEELKGEHLFVTTVENGDLSGVKEENGTLVGTGVAFALLNILKDKYEFEYTIIKANENMWTSRKKGVLELLTHHEVNLTAAFFPVLADFWNVTTFSPSLDTGEWVAMMKRPKESASGSGLLKPFTWPVWTLTLVSLFLVGPVIYLLILLKAKLCQDDQDVVFPLPSCIWFVYGALLKQGTTLNPVTDSSRILFATWWIFITILTAFYTANLTAFLTLSRFTLPIKSPRDIGEKHYKWVTNKGNSISDIIASESNVPHNSTMKGLGDVLGSPFTCPDTDDATILKEYVSKKDMIFVREKPIVKYVMYDDYKEKIKADIEEENRCVYVITKFNITTYPRAFAYSKGFKYQPVFDNAIQHLVESGIVKFKLGESLPDTEICPLDLGSKERQLRNSDLLMTYKIVGGGFVIATVVFIVELVITYCYHKKELKVKLPSLNILTNKEQLVKIRGDTVGLGNQYGFSKSQKHFSSSFVTPPPPYHTLFMPVEAPRKTVNGREYWIKNGQQLVPMRTPSALLFQYTH